VTLGRPAGGQLAADRRREQHQQRQRQRRANRRCRRDQQRDRRDRLGDREQHCAAGDNARGHAERTQGITGPRLIPSLPSRSDDEDGGERTPGSKQNPAHPLAS